MALGRDPTAGFFRVVYLLSVLLTSDALSNSVPVDTISKILDLRNINAIQYALRLLIVVVWYWMLK